MAFATLSVALFAIGLLTADDVCVVEVEGVYVFGLDPALLPLVNLLLLILLRDFPQSVEVLFLLAPADWPDLLLLVGLLLFIAPGLVDRPVDVVLFLVLDVVVLVDFALLPKYSHRLSQIKSGDNPTLLFEA